MQLQEEVLGFVNKILDTRIEEDSKTSESLEIQSSNKELLIKADI